MFWHRGDPAHHLDGRGQAEAGGLMAGGLGEVPREPVEMEGNNWNASVSRSSRRWTWPRPFTRRMRNGRDSELTSFYQGAGGASRRESRRRSSTPSFRSPRGDFLRGGDISGRLIAANLEKKEPHVPGRVRPEALHRPVGGLGSGGSRDQTDTCRPARRKPCHRARRGGARGDFHSNGSRRRVVK